MKPNKPAGKMKVEGQDYPCEHCGAYGHSSLGCSYIKDAWRKRAAPKKGKK